MAAKNARHLLKPLVERLRSLFDRTGVEIDDARVQIVTAMGSQRGEEGGAMRRHHDLRIEPTCQLDDEGGEALLQVRVQMEVGLINEQNALFPAFDRPDGADGYEIQGKFECLRFAAAQFIN